MKIHADPITVNCRKVLAGLALMDAPFELVHVDYFKGEQKQLPFAALNPNEAVPAMEDGDFVLWESNAILLYVADKLGRARACPSEPKARADLQRWLFWESAHWFPSCYVYLWENCIKPLLGRSPDSAALAAEAPRFHKLAGVLDQRLADRRWVMGEQPTIADIVLAAPMHLYAWQQLPLAPHRHLLRWISEDMESLPCWQATRVYRGFTLQADEAAA